MPLNSFVWVRVFVWTCACRGETEPRQKRRPEVMAAHLDFVLLSLPVVQSTCKYWTLLSLMRHYNKVWHLQRGKQKDYFKKIREKERERREEEEKPCCVWHKVQGGRVAVCHVSDWIHPTLWLFLYLSKLTVHCNFYLYIFFLSHCNTDWTSTFALLCAIMLPQCCLHVSMEVSEDVDT